MGNFSLTRKWLSGTQSVPVGSRLISGVDSVMTNPFNFDLLVFVKQVGLQNIARIISKQGICFDSIEKTFKKGEILSCDNISYYTWEASIHSRGVCSSPERSARLKNCLQEEEASAKLTCELLRGFSMTIIPYSCTHERTGQVGDGFEPPLLSYFLGAWLQSPGNHRRAHEGERAQQRMQPPSTERSRQRKPQVLRRWWQSQSSSWNPFALGWAKYLLDTWAKVVSEPQDG